MSNPLLQTIRGFPFSSAPWFKKKNIEDTLDYMPHDGDIIIASYPKTGTTWMQYIVLQIVTKGEIYPSIDDTLTKVIPFMEMTGVEAVENMIPPRIYKHHCPYDLVTKNKNAKTVYIYRNPEDIFVSYFLYWKQLRVNMQDFDQFFESYISGDIAYGRIFEHIRSYWKHRDDDNLLLVSYEKLIEDRKREILRIAKFLGEEHFLNLTNDESLLEKVVEQTSFDNMKKNLSFTHPIFFSDEASRMPSEFNKTVDFFRKGTPGDGKKTLSQDQRKRLKEVAKESMKGTGLIQEFFKE